MAPPLEPAYILVNIQLIMLVLKFCPIITIEPPPEPVVKLKIEQFTKLMLLF
jgi:hypothetical protein